MLAVGSSSSAAASVLAVGSPGPAAGPVLAIGKLGCLGIAGNKSYAAAVTKLLDPTGELFEQRVIAQGADRADEMQADQAKSFMQASSLANACRSWQTAPYA